MNTGKQNMNNLVRRRRRRAMAVGGVITLSFGLAATGAAYASAGTAGVGSANKGVAQGEQTLSPAVVAQSIALQPLRDVANALGEQGRGAFADVYSNLSLDRAHGKVILYVTDTARGAKLIRAAAHAHPGIQAGRVKVVKAAYTKQAIDAEIHRIMTAAAAVPPADLTVYGAGPAPDGSGIQLTVKPESVAHVRASMATAGGIPVTVSAGAVAIPATWRWNDVFQLIGGDVVVGQGYTGPGFCTTGLAAEGPTGRDVLLTADHCFPYDTHVSGDGNPIGNLSALPPGNSFGYIKGTNDTYDAEVIDTGRYNGTGTNSDEADQPQGKWYPVTSDNYSHNMDIVCQDGAYSYYQHWGVPCGIEVVNDNWTENEKWGGIIHTVQGVVGYNATYTGWTGDSGALVFTVTGANSREARGQVSSVLDIKNASGAYIEIFWTEAPPILATFNLHLNPHI